MMVIMLAMTVEGSQDHIGAEKTHDSIVARLSGYKFNFPPQRWT